MTRKVVRPPGAGFSVVKVPVLQRGSSIAKEESLEGKRATFEGFQRQTNYTHHRSGNEGNIA